MRKITLLLSILVCALWANAQTLLVEDFNYSIGSDIKSQGWPIHSGSGATKDSILVTNGLTFAGYPGSGVGGAAALTGAYCDHNKTFTSQTSGTVYASFMMNANATNRPGYFFHLGTNPMSTTFFTRVWINATGTGTAIGTYSPEPASYYPITAGTTYIFVVKYDFTTKVSSLYVLSSIPTTEPTTPAATYTETSTISGVGAVALRQYTFTGSTTNENITVDGIRVATSWSALFSSTNDVNTPSANKLSVSVSNNKLTITDAPSNAVEIFNTTGAKVVASQLINGSMNLNLAKGAYIVRSGNATAKIIL